jgi:hypothetical protein
MLYGVRFLGAHLKGANFENAVLVVADLRSVYPPYSLQGRGSLTDVA